MEPLGSLAFWLPRRTVALLTAAAFGRPMQRFEAALGHPISWLSSPNPRYRDSNMSIPLIAQDRSFLFTIILSTNLGLQLC